MTSTTKPHSSVTPAGGGDISPATLDRTTSLATSLSGGAGVVAAPPTLDDSPAEAGADVTLDEIFDFDLTALDEDDDSDQAAYPRSRRIICSTSSDGQTTIHRFGNVGIVLTAQETRQVYEFLSDSARIWGAAL